MGIKTSTFPGWCLSGETADAFLAELHRTKPNRKAKETLCLGDKLMNQYKEKGYVILKSRKDSTQDNNAASV